MPATTAPDLAMKDKDSTPIAVDMVPEYLNLLPLLYRNTKRHRQQEQISTAAASKSVICRKYTYTSFRAEEHRLM